MNTHAIESALRSSLEGSEQPVITSHGNEMVSIWWSGFFGCVRDEPDDFLVLQNLADNIKPPAVPSEFDCLAYCPKGRYEYDETRTGTMLAGQLLIYRKKWNDLRFVSDPQYGRMRAEMCRPDETTLFWQGNLKLPKFYGEKHVSVFIYAPTTGPTLSQRAWLCEFRERQDQLRQEVEPLLLEHYQQWQREFGGEPIDNIERLRQHMSPGSILIGQYDDRVEFNWGCSWDDEHGVEAELEDWKFTIR